MQSSDLIFVIILAAMNLAAGLGCAVPIARQLGRITKKPKTFFRYSAMLLILYLIECIAFAAGMATQLLSVALAFVWGVVLGFWLRGRGPGRQVIKTSFFVALYSTLPTVSFAILILAAWPAAGRSILTVEGGSALGIPAYVPWPLNTILGFCAALAIGTLVLKTAITTGEVSLLIHLGQGSSKRTY